MSDVIRETLGPDVQAAVWKGEIMPYDAVYERKISESNTYDWWIKAHKFAAGYNPKASMARYHDRFRGYCPRCQKETEDSQA